MVFQFFGEDFYNLGSMWKDKQPIAAAYFRI